MKKITTLMCAVALWCSAQAQRPALEFNGEGKFKIAQFTDVHLDLGNPYRQAQAEKTIAQMRYILDAERPDLVVERFASEAPPRYHYGRNWGLVRNEQLLAMLEKRLEERNAYQGEIFVSLQSL